MLKFINISIFILFLSNFALSQCKLQGVVDNQVCNGSGESGVTVSLYDCNGTFIASTTSGDGGSFSFDNISPGCYNLVGTKVCETKGEQDNYQHTCPPSGSSYFCMGGQLCDHGQIKGNNSLINLKTYKLLQNFPNPFNPVTVIQYDIPKESFVTLKIYDVAGKEIKELVNEMQVTGSYKVSFNAVELPSGIYFYTLKAGDFTETKRMLLVK